MPSALAIKALLQILLFSIIVSLNISLINPLAPRWNSADFTGFTAITTISTSATLLCKARSIWSEPILFVDCSFLFDELGDNSIWCGGYRLRFGPP
jgi:hypothetical protein